MCRQIGFSKQAQDDFAVTSYTRARQATAEGVFDGEIVPVEIKSKKGSTIVREDEKPADSMRTSSGAAAGVRARER